MQQKRIAVGITGASGAQYGIRLLQVLLQAGHHVHLMVSDAAWQVFREEMGWDPSKREAILAEWASWGELEYHTMRDFRAPIASGSYPCDGMVVIPCSMGTLSSIAHGASRNLLERSADVMLKEGRTLIMVPRETPLNQIHLQNMLTLAQAGAKILPAMPGFYHQPTTIDELIDFVVGKVLDNLRVEHHLFRRWGSK